MISYNDVTDEQLNKLRETRNQTGFEMKDNELVKYHVEWTNACVRIKNGGNKNVKRFRLITPQHPSNI